MVSYSLAAPLPATPMKESEGLAFVARETAFQNKLLETQLRSRQAMAKQRARPPFQTDTGETESTASVPDRHWRNREHDLRSRLTLAKQRARPPFQTDTGETESTASVPD